MKMRDEQHETKDDLKTPACKRKIHHDSIISRSPETEIFFPQRAVNREDR
jgi:hypothetical protein